jgi:membrane associated rhomboid family serine protease
MKIKYCALWLSLACIIVFVLQQVIPGFTNMFVLEQGKAIEVWRFVSAIFLHGGLAHIIANLFALALFGTILEGFIGSRKFLLVFFASGILANIVAIWFYPSSLGASGAIYGILGSLIIIRPMMTVWVSGIPMPMMIAGLVWAVGAVFGLFYPSEVGHIAHLSGIGIGLIFGSIWRDWSRKVERMEKLKLNEQYMQDWENYHMRK